MLSKAKKAFPTNFPKGRFDKKTLDSHGSGVKHDQRSLRAWLLTVFGNTITCSVAKINHYAQSKNCESCIL